MIRLIMSVSPADNHNATILLAGMSAHSDVDAFPMWAVEGFALPHMVVEALPYLRNLQNTWGITLPGPSEVRTLALLMESIRWDNMHMIHIVNEDLKVLSMGQFHKAAVVDKEFGE